MRPHRWKSLILPDSTNTSAEICQLTPPTWSPACLSSARGGSVCECAEGVRWTSCAFLCLHGSSILPINTLHAAHACGVFLHALRAAGESSCRVTPPPFCKLPAERQHPAVLQRNTPASFYTIKKNTPLDTKLKYPESFCLTPTKKRAQCGRKHCRSRRTESCAACWCCSTANSKSW